MVVSTLTTKSKKSGATHTWALELGATWMRMRMRMFIPSDEEKFFGRITGTSGEVPDLILQFHGWWTIVVVMWEGVGMSLVMVRLDTGSLRCSLTEWKS